METREYLQAKRRWLPWLVVAPLLAALVTAGVVSLLPAKTTAQVTAIVPPALMNSDSQIGFYVARLNDGLQLENVATDVATKAQIARSDLVQISADRSGRSDQFIVSVVTTAPSERAVAVAETATKVGTAFVARQSQRAADATTEIAQQYVAKAQNDIYAYQDKIGDLDPNNTYSTVSSALLVGEVRLTPAGQKDLVTQVRRFNELKAIQQTAMSSLATAQTVSTARAAEVVAAEKGSQILSSNLAPERIPGMRYIQPAGLAAIGVFLALLGFALLPDLLRTASNGFVTVTGPDGEPRLAPSTSAPLGPKGVSASAAEGSTSEPGGPDR